MGSKIEVIDMDAIRPTVDELSRRVDKSGRLYVRSVYKVVSGNYTMVTILAVKGDHHLEGFGFSKARPTDKYNAEIGFNIALKRAIEDAVS